MTDYETILRLRQLHEWLDRLAAMSEAIHGPLGRVVPEVPDHVRRELEERGLIFSTKEG